MVDTVVIQNANPTPNPTLEEQATAQGIDVNTLDSTATEQVADAPKILGKFNTQEDLVKAYQELEKKLGSGETKETPEAERTEPEAEVTTDTENNTETETQETAEEAAKKSGLDLDDLSAQYWANGSLTDEQYAALDEGGYPRHIVDQYIAGQKAQVELETAKVHLAVGGSEAYSDMLTWAKDSLSEAEVAAYDRAVNSDNMDTVMAAVKGLKARFDNEVGFEPQRSVTGRSGVPNLGRYESVAELKVDMGDPKYYSDPAFRAKVEQKLARSSIL